MAWTAPFSWTVGYVVTAAKLNEQLYYNMRYLKGLDGAATFESDLTVDNLITAGNVDGVDVGDHAANTTTAHGAVSAATASKIVVRDASARAKFAAPAAAGDALIKGTRVTADELPAVTDEYYLVGTGANMEERAVPTGPTKEIFATAFDGTWPSFQGYLVQSAGQSAYIHLIVPQDFSSITDIEVIFLPNETGASMNFVITTYYGAYNGSEDYNVHTETADPRDIGATVANQNLAHSIADLVDVAALVAGDLLTVKVEYDAAAVDSNTYVRGLRLKYT